MNIARRILASLLFRVASLLLTVSSASRRYAMAAMRRAIRLRCAAMRLSRKATPPTIVLLQRAAKDRRR
jgi:hypothetical protein